MDIENVLKRIAATCREMKSHTKCPRYRRIKPIQINHVRIVKLILRIQNKFWIYSFQIKAGI